MIADDIPFIMRDIKNEMPYHNDNIAIIPSTFKQLPKKAMEESHKVNNKFLNNHLGEIEEAVHKKLLNKIPFIHQQKKYHEESGILNHDNFFHCDLATGTPISYDNFKHQSYLVNPYMVSPAGCTGGDVLETFTSGTYGNFSAAYLVIMRSNGTQGVVDTCYDQVALDCNSSSGNIRMGAYSDTSDDPDVLYAQTASIPNTANYAFKSITEFTLTSVSTWFALQPDVDISVWEGGETSDCDRWHKFYTYGSFPNPAGAGYIEVASAQLRRMKIGHT